jgi:hypothetical protein
VSTPRSSVESVRVVTPVTTVRVVRPSSLVAPALVLAVLFWPAGIPLSIAAIVRSRRAGRVSRLAVVALGVGLLALAATVTLLVVILSGLVSLVPR